MHKPKQVGNLPLFVKCERRRFKFAHVSPRCPRMLDTCGSRNGKLKKAWGMDNHREKSWVYARFRPEYQQFRRANAGFISEYGFIKIRTEFSVQYITGFEG